MGKRADRYGAELDRVHELLLLAPRSARALMKELRCSKPTVYSRIDGLRERGVDVRERHEREGSRGPEATIYFLPGHEAPKGS